MILALTRRIFAGIVTLLLVYTATFVMVVSIPGNPFQSGDRNMPREAQQALRARYHMDNNWTFYAEYLTGAIHLDFGPAFTYSDWTCNQIIASSLPVSMLLGLLAILIALLVGLPLGVLGAVHRDNPIDFLGLFIVILGISIPTFVTGTAALTLFCVYLKWFPVGGWGTLRHLPLPALTLSLPFIAYIARLTRGSMIDTLHSDFIRTARAKGLAERTVIWKHALRVAFLPVLSYLGPATAQAMTGSFVVEKVFGVPGLGQHFVNAALNRDAGLILATVLVFSAALIALNLLVDLLYSVIDPRIRGAL